jgi:hypothetical protein
MQKGEGSSPFIHSPHHELLARLTAERIEHSAVETYSNGVWQVKTADPDEDAIAFTEPPAGLFAQ